MCANLATKSPVPVCAYDLNSAAVSTAVEKGAVAATDLEDIARAEMVFVCVPGEAETRSVFLDEGGLCEHAREGTTFIDCTTATVDVNREVAETLRSLGCEFADAPVARGRVRGHRRHPVRRVAQPAHDGACTERCIVRNLATLPPGCHAPHPEAGRAPPSRAARR